jgi:hypothetical protein
VSRIGYAAQQRGGKKPGEQPADATTPVESTETTATPTAKQKKPNTGGKKPSRLSNEAATGKTPLSSFSELAALLASQEQQDGNQGGN